jgi:hypothetical protein
MPPRSQSTPPRAFCPFSASVAGKVSPKRVTNKRERRKTGEQGFDCINPRISHLKYNNQAIKSQDPLTASWPYPVSHSSLSGHDGRSYIAIEGSDPSPQLELYNEKVSTKTLGETRTWKKRENSRVQGRLKVPHLVPPLRREHFKARDRRPTRVFG